MVWRELAACYELWGQRHASAAALKCGAQTRCPAVDDSGVGGGDDSSKKHPLGGLSARAAPLYLQMGANSLSMPPGGQEEDDDAAAGLAAGLASVGDAFRFGKGGPGGHALRGLIYSRLGKNGHATSAFAKAREAGLDPAVAALVDQLAATQAASVIEAVE